MSNLLDKALSPEGLNRAWLAVRNNPGEWSRGTPLSTMRRDAIRHVMELRESILDDRYRPDPVRLFSIDKADGKQRMISAYSNRDKLLQRAVLAVLEPLGEQLFHPDSVGYRPLCTVDLALAKVREHVREGLIWLGDADIEACFDNIPCRPVLRRLQDLCEDRRLVRLVRVWLKAGVAGRGWSWWRPLGLPQGMVLSPFLCNLYLHELDMALAKKKIPFVRFADNIVVFGRSPRKSKAALGYAKRRLHKLGLRLHPEKTRVIRSSRKYRFLGKRLPEVKT